MRSTYRANSNKVRSTTTGSDADDVYVPRWQHYDSLKFLDATEPTRNPTTSFTIRNEDDTYMDIEYLEENHTSSPGNAPMATPRKSILKSGPVKKKKTNDETVIDECLGILRAVTTSNDKENNKLIDSPADRSKHFGDFVASSLREMNPWHQSCAINEMSSVLLKYDKNNPKIHTG